MPRSSSRTPSSTRGWRRWSRPSISNLWQADVVVSTAIHEFFGLATVEAVYCECYPILPSRLAYPELLPAHGHERHLYADEAGLLERLRWAITHPDDLRRHSLRDHVAGFDWQSMIDKYDHLFETLQRT